MGGKRILYMYIHILKTCRFGTKSSLWYFCGGGGVLEGMCIWELEISVRSIWFPILIAVIHSLFLLVLSIEWRQLSSLRCGNQWIPPTQVT